MFNCFIARTGPLGWHFLSGCQKQFHLSPSWQALSSMIWTLTSKSITKQDHSNWSDGGGSVPHRLARSWNATRTQEKKSKDGLRATRVILEVRRNWLLIIANMSWRHHLVSWHKEEGSRRKRKQPAVGINSSRGGGGALTMGWKMSAAQTWWISALAESFYVEKAGRKTWNNLGRSFIRSARSSFLTTKIRSKLRLINWANHFCECRCFFPPSAVQPHHPLCFDFFYYFDASWVLHLHLFQGNLKKEKKMQVVFVSSMWESWLFNVLNSTLLNWQSASMCSDSDA